MSDSKPTPAPTEGATQDREASRTTLHELAEAGVSVWLDDLNRPMITDGDLQGYIDRGVLGVTTNPTIFHSSTACEIVFSASWASRGSTSIETRPSTPSVASYTGAKRSHASRTSSVVRVKTTSSTSLPSPASWVSCSV